MKKPYIIFCAVLLFLFCLPGCAEKENESFAAGRSYTYSGKSFSEIEGDAFTIWLMEDGTYSYYESILSSYIGIGEWSVSGRVLTLTDTEAERVNHFRIAGDDLIYIEENSSNFTFVKVKNGERFHGAADAL